MMELPIAHGTGWVRNTPSLRDWSYAAKPETLRSLAPTVDLDPQFPEPYDQATTNSCVGQSIIGAFEYARARQGLPHMDASTLFAYYVARMLGGNTASDNGAMIRDGILGLRDFGVCGSSYWPFIPAMVTSAPNALAFSQAQEDALVQFRSVPHTEAQIMGALAENYAIVIGAVVYQSFMQPPGGIVPMPSLHDHPVGAHAFALSGYDATRARYPGVLVKIHNSYGQGWGQQGRGWVPMDYLTNGQLSADATAIEVVRDDTPLPVPPPPPPPESWIGERIKAAMAKYGDRYAGGEVYLAGASGQGEYAVLWAESGRSYTYIFKLNRVVVGSLPTEELF